MRKVLYGAVLRHLWADARLPEVILGEVQYFDRPLEGSVRPELTKCDEQRCVDLSGYH